MQITNTVAITILGWAASSMAVTTFMNYRCLAQGGATRTNNYDILIDGVNGYHSDLRSPPDIVPHQQCERAIPPVGNDAKAGPNDAWMCVFENGPLDAKGDPEYQVMGWSDNPGCQCRAYQNTEANPLAGCSSWVCDGC